MSSATRTFETTVGANATEPLRVQRPRGLAVSCSAVVRGGSLRGIATRLLVELSRQRQCTGAMIELSDSGAAGIWRKSSFASQIVEPTVWGMVLPLRARGRTFGRVKLATTHPMDADTAERIEILCGTAAQAMLTVQREHQLATAERDLAKVEDALRETNHAMMKHQEVGRMGDFRYNTRTRESFGTIQCYTMFGQTPSPEEIERAKYSPYVIPLIVDFEAWTTMVVAEDRQRVIDTMRNAVACGAPFKFEYRIMVAGDLRHISCDGALYDDQVEDPTYYGVLSDITDRRRNEERLEVAQQELATAQRLAAMGEMAASIIHEVSQPITAIRSGTESCLRWLNIVGSEADLRASLERVAKDTVRASAVITGLRDLVKGADIKLSTIDLVDAVEEVIPLIRTKAARAHVALQISLSRGPISVRADRVQLQQVLINLTHNAIDAMASEGGERLLRIESSRPDAEHIAISVSDTGPGVDTDDLERLFDPLYTTKAEGMGLGLAICRRIVTAHRGRLNAGSNPPRGAKFELIIPITSF